MNIPELTPSYSPLFLTIFAVITIAAMVFVYKKKLLGNKTLRRLEILDKLPIDKKNSLIVVRAGEKNVLIGVSSNNMNVITEIEDEVKFKFEPHIVAKEEKIIEFPYSTNFGA